MQTTMSANPVKYCLHHPADVTVGSMLIYYTVKLCVVDGELLNILVDETQLEPKIMCLETGSILCKGTVDVVHWLSFRNVTHATVLRGLCGSGKDDKRVVARGLRNVLSWMNDWNDTTAIEDMLSNPLSGPVLLDKKFRHRNIRYFMQYSCTNNMDNARITAPDILLTMIICAWLRAHRDHKAPIQDTLPTIVRYVQNIRAELLQLESTIAGAESRKHFAACRAFDVDWIDTVDISAIATEGVFKFTQKRGEVQKALQVNSADVRVTVTIAEVALIESKAQALIDAAHWTQPTPSNTTSNTEDSGTTPLTAQIQVLHLSKQLGSNLLSDKLWETMSLPPGREKRKIQQITSLLEHISSLLIPGGVAVEFCSGGGYVGIPLAVMRPDCTVLLTDMNSVSLLYAKKRVKDLGLCNVKFLRCELSHIEDSLCFQSTGFIEEDVASATDSTVLKAEGSSLLKRFDVGIALHACGSATDSVLRICTAVGAAFVVSPCCYGFLQHFTGHTTFNAPDDRTQQQCACCDAAEDLAPPTCGVCSNTTTAESADNSRGAGSSSKLAQYPQSAAFRAQGWRAGWFAQLCRRADSTFWAHDSRAGTIGEGNAAGILAMRVIDSDRLLCAEDKGYEVFCTFMRPLEASVKNHILVGRKMTK